MGEINISNSSGRDAIVNTESVFSRLPVRWVDELGRQALNIRVVKSTIDRDIDALVAQAGGLDGVARALIEGDPEIDLETAGSFLRDTSRVYIDSDRRIVHKVQQFEVVKNPDGSQRERRPRSVPAPNIADENAPLRWSGILIKKEDAIRKFVFSAKLQLLHINGLTFDFLYAMAQELEAAQSLMLLGAGNKSNQPLILRRGGAPYRGFLEGRTRGDTYCLWLHLSNLELKKPTANGNEVTS